MSEVVGEGVVKLRSDRSGLDSDFKRAGKDAGGAFSGAFSTAAKGLAIGAVGTAAVTKLTTDAAALDVQMREVVTLLGETGDVAAASLGDIQEDVRALSNEFGTAQTTLTSGLYSAISAGVPRENAFTFMQVASRSAIAGVTDVETAVDGLSTVINAFGLEADDASAVSDSLFAAVQGGKTTFEELSASIFNVAPAAAAANVSFTEVNAAIATLTAGGTPTSVATTQIRAALTGLQKPSEDLNRIFQDLGYENAQLAIESEGLGFALNAVRDAADGNNGTLQKLLGSSEAVAAANVLAGTGAEKFTEELERQQNALGATDTAYETINESASRQFAILRENITNQTLRIGQALLDPLASVLSFLNNDLAPGFRTVVAAVRPFVAIAREAVDGPLTALQDLIGDQVLPALRDFGDYFVDTILPVLTDVAAVVVENFVPAVMGIAEVLYGTVYPAIVDTVAAVAQNLRPVFDRIVEVLRRDVIPTIANLAAYLVNDLIPAVQPVVARILQVVGALVRFGAAILGTVLPPLISLAGFIVRTVVPVIASLVKGAVQVVGAILEFGAAVVQVVQDVWGFGAALLDLVDGAIDSVTDAVRGLPGRLLNLGGLFLDAGRSIIGQFVDGLRGAGRLVSDVAGNIWNAVKGLLNDAIGRLNRALEFTISLPFGQSVSINPPDIPRLARGTESFQGGMTWVGEEGPELVALPAGSRVWPHRESMGMARGGAGGAGVTVNIGTLAPHDYGAFMAQMENQARLAAIGGRQVVGAA